MTYKRRRKFCSLQTRSILLVFFVVVFVEFLFLANFAGKISLEHFFATIAPEYLIELTNTRREEKKLEVLRVSPVLTEAARMKAEDMAEKGYFAHTSPEGITPWYWFDVVGYNYYYAGENLAVNFTNAYQVDEAWMESPKHKENIVNEHFEEIGIATATGEYKGSEAIFVVQLFGTKHEKQIVFTQEPSEEVATAVEEYKENEMILGEEIEKPEEVSEKDIFVGVKGEENKENAIEGETEEEKESFALIQKLDGQPTYITGNLNNIMITEDEELKYLSFWGRIISSPRKTLGYLLFISIMIFLPIGFLKFLLGKRIDPILAVANVLVILFVIFSSFFTTHYVLHFAGSFF